MVPKAGLEPASHRAADFKSAVFTISPLGHGTPSETRTQDSLFKRQML